MSKYITVTPAHGRDYKNRESVERDWQKGKDFVIRDLFSGHDGRYANNLDLAGYIVNVRYNKLTRICQIDNR